LLRGAGAVGGLAVLYVFYGVVCGGAVGMVYNAVLSALTRWFPSRTGMASGVMQMGFGIGSLLFGGIIASITAAHDVFVTFRVLAGIVFVVLFAGSFWVRLPREGEVGGSAADAAPTFEAGAESALRGDLGPMAMVRTSVFWWYAAWNIAICVAGLLVINSAAVIAAAFGAPAVLGLIVSVFNGAGRVLIGTLYDGRGRQFAMLTDSLVMLLAGAALLLGARTGHMALVFVGLPLVGIGYGGAPPSTAAIAQGFFGAKHFGENLAVMMFSVIPAAVLGPILSSRLQDAAGGAFDTTFVMILVVAALAIAFNQGLRRSEKKRGR
jgi:OFA family oxalate/formate antiporter-like MFS transporter